MLLYYFLFLLFFPFYSHTMNGPRSPLEPPSPAQRTFRAFAGSPSTATGLLFLDNGQQRHGEEWLNRIPPENILSHPTLHDIEEYKVEERKTSESHSVDTTTTHRHQSQSLKSEPYGHAPQVREGFTLQRTTPFSQQETAPSVKNIRTHTVQRCLLVSTFIICSLNLGFILRHDFDKNRCP